VKEVENESQKLQAAAAECCEEIVFQRGGIN